MAVMQNHSANGAPHVRFFCITHTVNNFANNYCILGQLYLFSADCAVVLALKRVFANCVISALVL